MCVRAQVVVFYNYVVHVVTCSARIVVCFSTSSTFCVTCCMLQVLNNKFNELINKGNKLVLEQIVTTLASVADSVEDKFIDYYDQ